MSIFETKEYRNLVVFSFIYMFTINKFCVDEVIFNAESVYRNGCL